MVQLVMYLPKLVLEVGLRQEAGDGNRWGGRRWTGLSLEYNQHQIPITMTSPHRLPAVLRPFKVCSFSVQSTGLLLLMCPSSEVSTVKSFLAAHNGA